jgi:hypothetical protein
MAPRELSNLIVKLADHIEKIEGFKLIQVSYDKDYGWFVIKVKENEKEKM